VLFAGAWLLRLQIFTFLGNALVEDDGPATAQAAVVLGGDGTGSRITKAAQLAQAGYVPLVLVSGPKSLLGHESDGEIEYAERNGFPSSIFRGVYLPEKINSTRAETAFLGKYLRAHGIHSILLVTSNYHTRRAARMMRSQNPSIRVRVVAAPDPDFTPDGWWRSREGQKTFFLEWMKTIAAALGI
jgi:uncharacterized SAM-binding protein YcdF (DUF218 family)